MAELISKERHDSSIVCYELIESKTSYPETDSLQSASIAKNTLDYHKLIGWIKDEKQCDNILRYLNSKYPGRQFFCTDFTKLHFVIQNNIYGDRNEKPKQAANKIFSSLWREK